MPNIYDFETADGRVKFQSGRPHVNLQLADLREAGMSDAFSEWLCGVPKWLQTASAHLLTKQKAPDDEEIRALADLCLAESNGQPGIFEPIPEGAFDTAPAGAVVRLKRIETVDGVNALDPDAILDFGDADISVVFGHNGTGKSGFARLLKHAAGCRARSELKSHAFVEQPKTPTATFQFEWNGVSRSEKWELSSGVLRGLRHAHVFDSEVATHYMTAKSEATYEPRRLRFLSSLVEICDKVRYELENRKSLLPSRMPDLPMEIANSIAADHIRKLKGSISVEAAKQAFSKSHGHAERIRSLDDALRTPDPAIRITQIDRDIVAINNTLKLIDNLTTGLSDAVVSDIELRAKSTASAKQVVMDTAKHVFANSDLAGIGSATWRALWEAARVYSEQVAYPSSPFPHIEDGAKCLLCQQTIIEAPKARLLAFEDFVRSEVEKLAIEAERHYRIAINALPKLPAREDWLARYATVPSTDMLAGATFEAANNRLNALTAWPFPTQIPLLDLAPLREAVAIWMSELNGERFLLMQTQQEGQRDRLTAELRDLRSLDWANVNIRLILAEVERLAKVDKLDAAIRKTNTASFTKKKTELAQQELVGGYQQRFAAELKELGAGRVPVQPAEARKGKAKIEFALSVVGARKSVAPESILSEGEARIVSLAVFLADVSAAEVRTPFIFDDPISSLDQDFEEAVVARLLKLARTRQVVVFTHRLSLLTLLREGAKKTQTGISTLRWREIALRRLGSRIGLQTETNILESKVDKALNDLILRRLTAAKAHFDAGLFEDYTHAMKAICSDLRILTERAVEEELLGGIVLRFRRDLQTKNRLTGLVKIASADCKLIDDIMTRYSCFEHSQPAELPGPQPDHESVKNDALRLKQWVLEFRKREVP